MVTNDFERSSAPDSIAITCPICNRMYSMPVRNEIEAEFFAKHPQVCPSAECQAKAAQKSVEAERERELRIQKWKADEELAERIEASGLKTYELTFDPEFHGANVALASWLIRNIDHSVWVYGETGRGKTRTIQHAARMAVRNRSVRYWPAYDLAAHLTEVSKHPEAALRDVYGADLLILDDLGVSNLTESRMTSLTAIVDRRYAGWDQVRRAQGSEQPVFGWSSYGRRRMLGGQLWITSQASPEELVAKLATVNAANAAALVRRLADMCTVHEAEVVR